MNMFLARIALYSTLGYLLDQGLGADWATWQFWCVLALFLAAEAIVRIDTREQTVKDMEGLSRHIGGQLDKLAAETERLEQQRRKQAND